MIFVRLLSLALVVLLGLAAPASAEAYPAPDGFVVDTAGVLSPAAEDSLEAALADYAQSTMNQVAVAVVASLDGVSVESYAQGLFNTWGIGLAGEDNGVLLLLAIDERASRVEVGRGLVDVLTDAEAQRILDAQVRPFAARGDFAGAVAAATTQIQVELGVFSARPHAAPSPADDPFGGGVAEYDDATTGGDADTSSSGGSNDDFAGPQERSRDTGGGFPGGFVLLAILFGLFSVFGRMAGGGRRRRGLGSSLGAGLLFGSLLNSGRRSGSGSRFGGFGGGGGGTWGGGGGGGTWGGGGGGGGFGGGSSGGGGASGGW